MWRSRRTIPDAGTVGANAAARLGAAAARTGGVRPLPVLNRADASNNVAGPAAYLIEHANMAKDGDTLGGGKAGRFTARRAVSTRQGRAPVLGVVAAGGGTRRDQ
jgi:hypothetical protein